MESCEEYISLVETRTLNLLGTNVITLDQIRDTGRKDSTHTDLINIIRHGFPKAKQETKSHLREYWEVRHRLTSDNGIVLLDNRIVIPSALRKLVLEHLHVGHQGKI